MSVTVYKQHVLSEVLTYSFTPKPWEAAKDADPFTLQMHSFYLIFQNPECFNDNHLVSDIQEKRLSGNELYDVVCRAVESNYTYTQQGYKNEAWSQKRVVRTSVCSLWLFVLIGLYNLFFQHVQLAVANNKPLYPLNQFKLTARTNAVFKNFGSVPKMNINDWKDTCDESTLYVPRHFDVDPCKGLFEQLFNLMQYNPHQSTEVMTLKLTLYSFVGLEIWHSAFDQSKSIPDILNPFAWMLTDFPDTKYARIIQQAVNQVPMDTERWLNMYRNNPNNAFKSFRSALQKFILPYIKESYTSGAFFPFDSKASGEQSAWERKLVLASIEKLGLVNWSLISDVRVFSLATTMLSNMRDRKIDLNIRSAWSVMGLRLYRMVSLPRFTFAHALDICYIRPVVQNILWKMARYPFISNAKTREALRTALSEHRLQAKIALLFRSVLIYTDHWDSQKSSSRKFEDISTEMENKRIISTRDKHKEKCRLKYKDKEERDACSSMNVSVGVFGRLQDYASSYCRSIVDDRNGAILALLPFANDECANGNGIGCAIGVAKTAIAGSVLGAKTAIAGSVLGAKTAIAGSVLGAKTASVGIKAVDATYRGTKAAYIAAKAAYEDSGLGAKTASVGIKVVDLLGQAMTSDNYAVAVEQRETEGMLQRANETVSLTSSSAPAAAAADALINLMIPRFQLIFGVDEVNLAAVQIILQVCIICEKYPRLH
jgi:hypothetical protein